MYIVIKPIVIETDDGIEPKNLCVFYGFTSLGTRKIIAIYFEEIKYRGVEDILFVSMDGLTRLSEAIEKVFPKTRTQRCIVHIVRNIYSTLDKKEAKSIISDFKQIYTASNLNNAKLAYENFLKKYSKNTKLIRKVNSLIDYVFSIFEYPIEIRKIIYTTNPIESLNSCLRKVTRGKGSFISVEALLKVLYLRIKDLESKWSIGTKNWNTVKNQILQLFCDRVLKYLVDDKEVDRLLFISSIPKSELFSSLIQSLNVASGISFSLAYSVLHLPLTLYLSK